MAHFSKFRDRVSDQGKLFLITVIIGLSAGVAALLFRQAAEGLFNLLIQGPSTWPWWGFVLFSMVSITVGALIAGILMARYAPDASGSGIPQVKLGYHRGENEFTWKLLFVKFFGGVVAIGSGSSLGREGPTIHIGAAIASKVSGWFGASKESKGAAVCAGSAAGLAAAFNSPLAGVTLVLEEIASGRDEEKFAGRALLAAALAVVVIHVFTGDQPALPMNEALLPTVRSLWLAAGAAVLAGGMGLLFQAGTMKLRWKMKHSKLPGYARPAVGAAVAGVFGAGAFLLTGNTGVFGLGETQLLGGLNNELVWSAALILAVGKLVATVLCYGSGGCGGIFAPILFFGGMTGAFLAGVLEAPLGLTAAEKSILAVTGITACLSAVVRAPLTSILIVMEMTREILMVPALMIAAVIGVYLNRMFFAEGFYDAALRQDGTPVE